ncbi:hypothetical protein AWC38_SpisGene7138 [Stylophora pistillata]|uniref:Uncharacterized protein n=1 Tax=Stylophora pistillata TaxID=50429 RepID=A0A2B4SHS4_STYPI|nr:hypothetical protein AWC38_SpisGene7138 [Stylophora pistillata]
MSSPSDSSSCTSESDQENFIIDEVIGEISEFAPYDDNYEPLATEEEAAAYNERVHREEEEEQQPVSAKIFGRDSVAMGPAAETYVGYERALSQKDPKYLCTAMLPCTMLWPWLANELINSVKVDNPYYVWFKDNETSPDHKSHLERFVYHFFAQVDLEEQKKCLSIFQEG